MSKNEQLERQPAEKESNGGGEPQLMQKLTCDGGDVWIYEYCLQSDEDGEFYLDVKAGVNADAGNCILENPEFARGQQLRCLYDGAGVSATLTIWTISQSLLEEVPASVAGSHAIAFRFVCAEVVGADVKMDLYEFVLPHVNFGFADYCSVFKATDGRKGIEPDHIRFQIDGIQWTLRKLFKHNNRLLPAREAFAQQAKEGTSELKSIFSGHAALQVGAIDIERIAGESQADNICWVLSLAMGQRVSWSQLWTRTEGEEVFLKRRPAALPMKPSALRPITNHNHELQTFLETSYPIMNKNSDWWSKTLNWYIVAREDSTVESSAIIFSMLLDRISTHVLQGRSFTDQIGPDLTGVFANKSLTQELTHKLTELLLQYASKWHAGKSTALVNIIKGWNNSLPYSRKIIFTLDALGIKPPPSHVLEPRHDIMHAGSFESVAGDIMTYFKDTSRYMLAILFHMLGYKGAFRVIGDLEEHQISNYLTSSLAVPKTE